MDRIIVYRLSSSDADMLEKLVRAPGTPVKAPATSATAIFGASVHAVHDIVKLVVLPMAAGHFAR